MQPLRQNVLYSERCKEAPRRRSSSIGWFFLSSMPPTLLPKRQPKETREDATSTSDDDGAPSSVCPSVSTTHFSPPPPPPPPEKPREKLVCEVCHQTFSSQRSLKRHRESTHRQSAGFACRLCDQRFYRKDHLKRHHTRKHADEQYETPAAHTCPICRKSFHYRDHLRQHLKTHQPTSPAVSPPTQSTQPALRTDARACPPDVLASVPEECRQCYGDNWSQIRSRQRGGQVLQVHTQRLETNSDIGDMLRTLFRAQRNAFRINLSFGFILTNVETGETRYYYPSQNGLIFDQPLVMADEADLERVLQRVGETD